jgi:tetratricopeptide (TPR) repeat protein
MIAEPRLQHVIEREEFKEAMIGVVERRELDSFRVPSWKVLETQARVTLDRQPEVAGARHELGWSLLRQGRHAEAEDIFRDLAESGWNPAASSYNVACCALLQGRKDDAMDWLEKAVEAGLRNPNQFVSDRDLRPLRGLPRFERLIEELRLEQDR